MEKLSGPELPPASGGKPKQLVIFLHGLGSNGDDLLQLAEDRFSDILPDAHFISPNAPIELPPMPTFFGFMKGYQWFDWIPDDKEEMLRQAKKSSVILDSFIDEQLERFNLEPKNLVLIGFSQGTVMSLLTGLNREKKIGGIIGYSGALLNREEFKSSPDICLIHGTMDDVVPFTAMENAKEALQNSGVRVETHAIEGLAHGINEEAIEAGGNFLRKVLIHRK